MRRMHVDQHQAMRVLGKHVHTVQLSQSKPQWWYIVILLARLARPRAHNLGVLRYLLSHAQAHRPLSGREERRLAGRLPKPATRARRARTYSGFGQRSMQR